MKWLTELMTVAERREVFAAWNASDPLGAGMLFNTAARLPAWCRAHCDSSDPAARNGAARHGLTRYLDAAAIRELTQGEG